MRNYFRRDNNLKEFFARGMTWNCARENYGFEGEDAEFKADCLESLLDTIAGFMPGPYLTARITKQTKSMASVFEIIWEHYDVNPNPCTFLDFADLCLAQDERYIDLFNRMLYHAEQHVVKANTTINGEQVLVDESLTHSHKNLIALNWLNSVHPKLLGIVKLEKHKELKAGQQLYTLVQDIAKNVDEWLKRHDHSLPKRSAESSLDDTAVRNVRFDRFPRGTGRGQPRGRGGYRGAQPSYNRGSSQYRQTNQSAGKFCPGCHYLAQELRLDVNFKHFPAECTRKHTVLRLLKAEEQFLEDEAGDHDEEEDLEDNQHPLQESQQGNHCSQSLSDNENMQKSAKLEKNTSQSLKSKYIPNFKQCGNRNLLLCMSV